MVKKQSHAATTEKSPPGKIAIPMKKFCTTEIIPSAPQNVSTPPQKQFDPGPLNNLNLLENSTATIRNILTTQACNHLNQTTQTKYQPLSGKKLPTFPENFQPLQTTEAM